MCVCVCVCVRERERERERERDGQSKRDGEREKATDGKRVARERDKVGDRNTHTMVKGLVGALTFLFTRPLYFHAFFPVRLFGSCQGKER